MSMSVLDKKIIVCAFFLITIIVACVKTTNKPILTPSTSTIAQIIRLGTNLTILDSAMSKSGVLKTLDSTNSVAGPFTLFAPVDIAFTNAGIYDSTINRDTIPSLKRLMLYHIFAGHAKTVSDWESAITMRNQPFESASPGDYFFLTLDSTGFYINGNPITQADVMANNGVIQAISGVLIPPVGSINYILDSISVGQDTTLTYLNFAIAKAKQSSLFPYLNMLLSSSGTYTDSLYTFFAPTNAAFRLTADSTQAIIEAANADSLARLLLTHIIPNRVFSSDFPVDSIRFSYAGDSLFFNSLIGYSIQSKGDSTATSFGSVNILATNGVIHKINQVLFPFYPF